MDVGGHDLQLELPDLVVFRTRGRVVASDVETVAQVLKDAGSSGTAYVLAVMETREFEGSPKARRQFVETLRGLSTLVGAVVGADFRTRVIIRFLENISRLMSKLTLRIGCHDDEASAREWLRTQGCVACGAEAKKA